MSFGELIWFYVCDYVEWVIIVDDVVIMSVM